MKLRLMGTADECMAVLLALRTLPGLDLVDVAGPYPNRPPSRLVRLYLDARLIADRKEESR